MPVNASASSRAGGGPRASSLGMYAPSGRDSTALSEQLRRELTVERRLGAAVHGAFELHCPEHHLGVAGVIFVDRDRAVGAVDGLKPAPGMARRLRAGRALAKEQNVGRDFRSRIALERGVRQPYRAQQIGMFGQMPADGIVLLVHRVAAGNERHDAAGPQLLKRFGEEVIVNGARELGLHRGVMHSVIAERNVSDDGIEVIIRERRFLKPFGEYRGIGIELLSRSGP